MNSDYRIRRAVIDDAPIIAHQRSSMFRDMGDLSGPDIARLENASFVYIRQMMAEQRYLGWLVERHGEVVAAVARAIER